MDIFKKAKRIAGNLYRGNTNQNIDYKWHKLDNAATLFPATATESASNVFRVSVVLRDNVEKLSLEKALCLTLKEYPSFNVTLKRGLFWHFFETNINNPVVSAESCYPCMYIDAKDNAGYMFKVTYYGKRINLEVFHAITDGFGAFEFLKTLLYNYVNVRYENSITLEMKNMPIFANPELDAEDSYKENYTKTKIPQDKFHKSYRIKGTKLPYSMLNVIQATMSTKQILTLAKSHNATLTEYLTAVYIFSIYTKNAKKKIGRNPIYVCIPVNLRGYFNSRTVRNFFSYINIGLFEKQEEYTFLEVLEIVKQQIKSKLTKEYMERKIAYGVAVESNIFSRFTFLFIKNIILRQAYKRTTQTYSTSLSNLGRVTIESMYEEYVDRFECFHAVTEMQPIKCGICSYKDVLVISFDSSMEEVNIFQNFFTYLTQQGIDVTIISNIQNN